MPRPIKTRSASMSAIISKRSRSEPPNCGGRRRIRAKRSRRTSGTAALFRPDDPLAPPKKVFDEPWQAQALANADTMVRTERFTATEWREALGAALSESESKGAPDAFESYYSAGVVALERLCEARGGISRDDRAARRAAHEAAHLRSPHRQTFQIVSSRIGPRSHRTCRRLRPARAGGRPSRVTKADPRCSIELSAERRLDMPPGGNLCLRT